MKSLAELWRVLAYELASRCHTSATLDWKTVRSRVEHEGLSFLTITLPSFAKDFERSLDSGVIGDDQFLSFRKGPGGLPRFLGGFLRHVFDEHGVLLDHVNHETTDAIFAIRELCYLYSKIELPCSSEREARAVESFVHADAETGVWDDSHSDEDLADLVRISSLLFSDVFTKMDQKIYEGDVRPSHGPGATADRLRGNAKYDLAYWPSRLDACFPYMEYGVPSLSDYSHLADRVSFSDEDSEVPARVVLVPKTMKAPRVIAAEPTALQYMQQAIARPLVELLEADVHPFAGMISFSDQLTNQDLARTGSFTRGLATLDMSEASDRVSLRQALSVVSRFPWLREAVLATRSKSAELPDGRVIPLRKFAAMGSALCFPMEAMVFLAAIFMGIERKLIAEGSRKRLTRRDIASFKGSVRVFGDDIIVPVDCVPYVLEVFTHFGWKINTQKSFWTGMFRESCGGDFYAGTDVTPIRIRQMLPTSRRAHTELESVVASRNHFYGEGLWATARWLDRWLEKVLPHFPIVEPTSQVLGRWSVFPYSMEKYDGVLHRPLVRGYVPVPRIPISLASGEGNLLKCLLSSHEDPRHLERAGRPSVVDIKLRWMPPY
jgi:hypothetical protein